MLLPPRSYRPILLAAAIACVAAALIGGLRFGSTLYLYTDVKGKPGALQGAMTAISGFLLIAGGVFMGLVGGTLRRRGDRAGLAFQGFAALLAFLAFDEVVMVHEWAAEKLQASGVPKLLGIDHDLYVFAIYGMIAIGCGLFMSRTLLRHREALPMLVWMIAFAVTSEAIDFVPWDSLTPSQQSLLGPIEEGTKTMATVCAVLYAHALHRATSKDPADAPAESSDASNRDS